MIRTGQTLEIPVTGERFRFTETSATTDCELLAFELSLTHWFYLYLPWVLPFVLLALFLPREPHPDEAAST
jgi:hypothetical protein